MKFTIEQARAISGLTQSKMAVKLGMCEKTYIQYEKYRKAFRMDAAAQFVKVVGLEMDDVIFFQQKVHKICS